tara:strand:- start:152 stop:802 length:651 start_codon:yes stop_codon:yes gene_type:complete
LQILVELIGDLMRIRRSDRDLSVQLRSIDVLAEFKKGIDLEIKFLDVKRLFLAGFGWRVAKMGYDPDDVLQEVYKGLLIRNDGKCPWDKNKASLGHYVHMVTGCILSNYTRKKERIRSREMIGIRGSDGDYHDVAEVVEDVFVDKGDSEDIDDITKWILDQVDLDEDTSDALIRIVPLLIEGWSKREIARVLGTTRREVDGLMGVLRDVYEPCSVV